MNAHRPLSFPAFLLMILLPLTVLGGILSISGQEAEERENHRQQEHLESEIRRARFHAEPREFIIRTFRRLYRFLLAQRFSPVALEQAAGASHPFPVEAGVFSPTGKLVLPKSGGKGGRRVMQNLWECLLSGQVTIKQEKQFQALFGSSWDFGYFQRNQGSLMPTGRNSLDGLAIWQQGPASAGILLHAPRIPEPWFCLRAIFRHLSPIGLTAVHDPRRSRTLRCGRPWSNWQDHFRAAIRSPGMLIRADGKAFLARRSPEGFWFFAGRIDTGTGPFFSGWWVLFAFPGFGLLLGIQWWRASGGDPLGRLSVSARILTMALTAGVIPLVLLLGLANRYVQIKRETLERQWHEHHIDFLRSLDSRYHHQEFIVLREARRLSRMDWGKLQGKDFLEPFERGMRRSRIARAETRDLSGNVLASSDPGSLFDQLLSIFSRQVLRRYIQAPIPQPTDPAEILAIKIIMSTRLGSSGMFDRPDELSVLGVSGRGGHWYWDVRQPPTRDSWAFFSVNNHTRSNRDFFLAALEREKAAVFLSDSWTWYPKNPPRDTLRILAYKAISEGKPSRLRISGHHTEYLATAYPSTAIIGACYLTLSDLAPVFSEVNRFRRGVGLALLITLFLVIVFARVLSQFLLMPIQEVSRGINALTHKDFRCSVPELGHNELGFLGASINEMLGELREVTMGSTFQKSLINLQPDNIPGYQVSLFYQPAGDLGGDYCDLLPLPNGGFLIITGDVTGHGIASAMLTAMAKAICFAASREGAGLATLFNRLNVFILQTLKKSRLMPAVAGILDPRHHTFEWLCGGHPYPLYRTQTGRVDFLKMPQNPLGARKKTVWEPRVQPMAPGDCIMFYTDGITERINPDNEMFGFDRLIEVFSATAPYSPHGTTGIVLEELESFARGTTPDDDITLVLIKRLASDESGNGEPG
jgi:hypothetical protein